MPKAEIHAQWGKHFTGEHSNTSGTSLIQQLNGSLRDIVVFALGTNDHGNLSESDFNNVINALSGHTVVFMTFYTDDDLDWSYENSLVRQAASTHSNVKIADWAAAASSNPAKYIDPEDPWHPSIHDGTLLFAKTVYEAIDCKGGSNDSCVAPSVEGGTAEEKIWNLLTQFLTDEQAAGVMGNMFAESGFNPVIHNQGAYSSSWPYDIENGTGKSYAIGLIQWTKGRRTDMLASIDSKYRNYFFHPEKYNKMDGNQFLAAVGEEVFDYLISREIEFLKMEVTTGSSYLRWYNGSYSSAADQATGFNRIVEVSGDTAGTRETAAGDYYKLYGGTSGSITACRTSSDAEDIDEDIDANIEEGGLTYEQALQFVKLYGANRNGSSQAATGDTLWNMCNGGGSNCVTFSAFFVNKFTSRNNTTGNGSRFAANIGVRPTKTLEIFSVFSSDGGDKNCTNAKGEPISCGHTGVVLGYHDGKWIVAHASCSRQSKGTGDGTKSGSGSAFVVEESSSNPEQWSYPGSKYSNYYFANLKGDTNVNAISEYLKNGV